MNIALYGINGTYNFGCEAIVRGAARFIVDLDLGARIQYMSYSYDYDKKMLSDLDLDIVKVPIKKIIFKRILNKSLQITNYDKRLLYFDPKQLLNNTDMLFSIGGDIYTIPAVLREKAEYPYYNHLIDFCNQSGKPVVVYGASVGPWGSYHKAVDYYKENMMKYKAILCREKSSVEYLTSLGFTNTIFFPDPAFLLGTGKNRNGESIGINLSPLSLDEIYGEHSDEHIAKLASLIDQIIDEFRRPILLIPHVLSPNENDNDLLFLEKIKKQMKNENAVVIADSSKGFLGIKDQIQACRMVISARMHCAINALTENIPTIFLSYSQKSIGMCDYVYGDKDWVIDFRKIETQLIQKMNAMEEHRDDIIKHLISRNKEIKIDHYKNLKKVKSLLC